MYTAEYREARRKFFEDLRDSHDRLIKYWMHIWRKSKSVEEMQEIYERMCDHEKANQYCQDAIKALEMMDKEENRNGKTEE
mgnify:CR=1 FL=1